MVEKWIKNARIKKMVNDNNPNIQGICGHFGCSDASGQPKCNHAKYSKNFNGCPPTITSCGGYELNEEDMIVVNAGFKSQTTFKYILDLFGIIVPNLAIIRILFPSLLSAVFNINLK